MWLILGKMGDKRFALEVDDVEKVQKFVQENDNKGLYRTIRKGKFSSNYEKVFKDIFLEILERGDSGINFYESIDDEKVEFQEIEQE